MWDFPRPGIEPVSPALTGGFFTTEPLFESPQDNPVLKRWTEIVNTHFTKEDRWMVSKHMERCSTSLVIREMQIRTTMNWDYIPIQFSSVQSFVSDSLQPHELQHARLPCPSPTPGIQPNPCPLIRWCHPTISSSIVPFSSCPQSFLALRSFQMSQIFTSAGQSIEVSASTSVLPMNNQDWSPLGWTGWISLQSKGLSRVFSNTTVQKHQFFGTQLSL